MNPVTNASWLGYVDQAVLRRLNDAMTADGRRLSRPLKRVQCEDFFDAPGAAETIAAHNIPVPCGLLSFPQIQYLSTLPQQGSQLVAVDSVFTYAFALAFERGNDPDRGLTYEAMALTQRILAAFSFGDTADKTTFPVHMDYAALLNWTPYTDDKLVIQMARFQITIRGFDRADRSTGAVD